jgi:hypothetical protein
MSKRREMTGEGLAKILAKFEANPPRKSRRAIYFIWISWPWLVGEVTESQAN